MNITYKRSVRDFGDGYQEMARMIENRNSVIITNNDKNEAVLIPYDEYEKYEEFLHTLYVREKLAEAEAIANDPGEWMDIEEFMDEWDGWEADKT